MMLHLPLILKIYLAQVNRPIFQIGLYFFLLNVSTTDAFLTAMSHGILPIAASMSLEACMLSIYSSAY